MKKTLLGCLLLASAGASAQTYQSFNEFNYVNTKHDDGFAFTSHYFFKPQAMIGVLDEFGYLNTDTNVYGSVNNYADDNAFNLGGEYFLPNNFFVTGDIYKQGDYDTYSAGAGLLVNDNLKVSARYVDDDDADGQAFARVEYNHQINQIDYLAVSFDTEVDLDSWHLAGRYFMALNNSQHIGVDASLVDNGFDTRTRVFGNYYFNQAMSAGIGLDDGDIELRAKYYTDINFAFSIGYHEYQDTLTFAVHGQF